MGLKHTLLVIFATIMFAAQFGRLFTSKTHMINQSVLLVTAHPDDETMFFGPTLMHILKKSRNNSVNILVLSNGNGSGLGEVRAAEMAAAVEALRLPAQNATVIDDARIPDSMSVEWDQEVVTEYVRDALVKHKVDTVITFDKDGVSGHPNHAAVHFGTLRAALEYAAENENFSMMSLYSVPLWRKFLFSADGIFSRIITIPNVQYHLINSQTDYHWVRQALRKHDSQMVWFRHLWSFFSRYMIVNDLMEVNFGRALQATQFKDAQARASLEAKIIKPIGTEGKNIQTSVQRPKPTKNRAVTRAKPQLSATAKPAAKPQSPQHVEL